jgi:hypothetical protein
MRTDTPRGYARDAAFTGVVVLLIEGAFSRFDLLG